MNIRLCISLIWLFLNVTLTSENFNMAERLQRNVPFLEVLARGTPMQKKAILKGAGDDLCRCFAEICQNVLHGCLNLTDHETNKLKKHKGSIRALGDKKVPLSRKKKIVRQKGGFLQLLAAPILGLLGDLVIGGIKKAVVRGKQRRAAARHKRNQKNRN